MAKKKAGSSTADLINMIVGGSQQEEPTQAADPVVTEQPVMDIPPETAEPLAENTPKEDVVQSGDAGMETQEAPDIPAETQVQSEPAAEQEELPKEEKKSPVMGHKRGRPATESNKKLFSIYLDPEIDRALDFRVARENDKNRSGHVNAALREYLATDIAMLDYLDS